MKRKTLLMATVALSLISGNGNLRADEGVNSKGSVATAQKTEKKSRKKKVQLCKECGKPEKQCECKGENHGNEKALDPQMSGKKEETK